MRGLPLLWRISPANDLAGESANPLNYWIFSAGNWFVACRTASSWRPLRHDLTRQEMPPCAAGLTRVIFRRHGTCFIALQQFGGHFLGIDMPEERSQQSWQLDPGDELLLATDGFYDQPTGDGRLADNLTALPSPLRAVATGYRPLRR